MTPCVDFHECGQCEDGCKVVCAKQPGYRAKSPARCAANRDGECRHPGCPQKQNWQPCCPIPDYPDEE